jgi:hypothetical protein
MRVSERRNSLSAPRGELSAAGRRDAGISKISDATLLPRIWIIASKRLSGWQADRHPVGIAVNWLLRALNFG